MNAARLLALYERIAEAPDAIGRLRSFVLDLAMRGKLVPQDPSDEPASELLNLIAMEKVRLVKAGEIRKPKQLAPMHSKDIPAPERIGGWIWVRLGTVATLITKGSTPTSYGHSYTDAGVNFVKVESIRNGLLRPENITSFISKTTHEFLARSRLADGDILFSIAGSIGTCAVVADQILPANTNQALAIIRGTRTTFVSEFLLKVLQSSVASSVLGKARGGAMNNVSLEDINNFVVPLPPLAEQRRIVAKVDELMALCDRLEAARVEREAARDRFTAASLARLNAPDPDPASFATHARFAINTLPTLTTRPDQIKQVRQTILNLAVRGKLVPQDANDEPAPELLKRIAKERAMLIKAGAIPAKKEPVRDPSRMTDELPASWSAIALGEVCNLVTSGSRGWAEFYATSGPGFIRAQNIRFGKLRLDDLAFVNPPSNSEGSRTQVAKSDLLIVITGAGVTNPALLDHDPGEAYVSQHVGLVRPSDQRLSEWLLLCLMADAGGRAELVERAYGAGKPGLNLDNIRSLSIPLPPLAEQRRIVAKVDDLMAICDKLEASLTSADATRRRLLEALLGEALSVDIEERKVA